MKEYITADLKQAYDEAMDCRQYSVNETEYSVNINHDSKELIIAIMGSWQKSDWFYNFMFFKVPYKNMKSKFRVHAGFRKKYHDIRDQMLAEVLPLKGYKIKIRAFSQGSGIAYLMHEDLLYHTSVQPDTVLFGTPRAFSVWNHKVLEGRLSGITRYENGDDIVCHIPFAIQGFRHYGKKIHIGRERRWWKLSIKDHTHYEDNL